MAGPKEVWESLTMKLHNSMAVLRTLSKAWLCGGADGDLNAPEMDRSPPPSTPLYSFEVEQLQRSTELKISISA